jgi:hypothetical protein
MIAQASPKKKIVSSGQTGAARGEGTPADPIGEALPHGGKGSAGRQASRWEMSEETFCRPGPLGGGLVLMPRLRRLRGDLPTAEADLSEALEIAERGSMRLHECDAHLEWARLCRQRGDRDGLEQHVARARKLVEETGYGRRRREVEWLERQISAMPAP